MTTENIIKDKLGFLTTNYHLDFEYVENRGSHYIFRNKYGFIEFYEWPQFDESAIFVTYGMVSKNIHLIEHYPKAIGDFYRRHRGIKWFFKDERFDYWEMIANIIKTEISQHNNIFGLDL